MWRKKVGACRRKLEQRMLCMRHQDRSEGEVKFPMPVPAWPVRYPLCLSRTAVCIVYLMNTRRRSYVTLVLTTPHFCTQSTLLLDQAHNNFHLTRRLCFSQGDELSCISTIQTEDPRSFEGPINSFCDAAASFMSPSRRLVYDFCPTEALREALQ